MAELKNVKIRKRTEWTGLLEKTTRKLEQTISKEKK
tara:strand:+ start:107 stop:214 length:108 start_codon:yes stop_codon:yes gene_type:complete